jgi:hypothetical protein
MPLSKQDLSEVFLGLAEKQTIDAMHQVLTEQAANLPILQKGTQEQQEDAQRIADKILKSELSAWAEGMREDPSSAPDDVEEWMETFEDGLEVFEQSIGDNIAKERGLPTLLPFDAEAPENLPSEDCHIASMNVPAAAKLDGSNLVFTIGLSSCTGVTLYDPETKVGAVMHVYDSKSKVTDALDRMKELDDSVSPGRLQATIMPGMTDGVNKAHLETIHNQLQAAGVPPGNVRDFSLEGRIAESVYLHQGGAVSANLKGGPPAPEIATEPPEAAELKEPVRRTIKDDLGALKTASHHDRQVRAGSTLESLDLAGDVRKASAAQKLSGGGHSTV